MLFKSRCNKIKNEERGMSALLLIIMLGSLIVVYSVTISVSTVFGSQASNNQIKSDTNYYLAEAGVEDTLRILMLDPTYDPGTVGSPLGTYDVTLTDLGGGNTEINTEVTNHNTTRRSSMVFSQNTEAVPDAADFGMFAGEELAFLHSSNSAGRKGSITGDLYAKDRIRVVRFVVGWADGSETTTMISAGNYGEGGGVGEMQDQLYKNSETYYTEMYTLNDVGTHNSASADHLTVYYKDGSKQRIRLPSGPNVNSIEDSDLIIDELATPEFDFDDTCTEDIDEDETVYLYDNDFEFEAHIASVNGNLEDGVHCIENGDVYLDSGYDVTLNGSIVSMNGYLEILDYLNLTTIYDLPVLAANGDLVIGYRTGNNPAPNSADITGIIYASQDVIIGNHGSDESTTEPYFEMTGAVWASKNLYVLQSNNIKNLNLHIEFDQTMGQSIRNFTTSETGQIILKSWDENFE